MLPDLRIHRSYTVPRPRVLSDSAGSGDTNMRRILKYAPNPGTGMLFGA